MGRILCIGEILIDFISPARDSSEEKNFYQHPGGAPANVAMGLSKLGSLVYFLGKVGNDPFGKFLKDTLTEYEVDTTYLYNTNVNTTLAFVNVDERGERDFYFYRNPGADTQIKKAEVEKIDFRKFKILHFGSLNLTHNPSRDSIFKALEKTDRENNIISFDPNLRFSLWENKEKARETISKVLPFINLLRLNEEELSFLTQEQDVNKAARIMLNRGIELVIVSLGEDGVYFNSAKYGKDYVKGFKVKVKDTTGAGDALTAAILSKVISYSGVSEIDKNKLREIMKFGNGVAALSTTKKGAVYSIPHKEEVEDLVS